MQAWWSNVESRYSTYEHTASRSSAGCPGKQEAAPGGSGSFSLPPSLCAVHGCAVYLYCTVHTYLSRLHPRLDDVFRTGQGWKTRHAGGGGGGERCRKTCWHPNTARHPSHRLGGSQWPVARQAHKSAHFGARRLVLVRVLILSLQAAAGHASERARTQLQKVIHHPSRAARAKLGKTNSGGTFSCAMYEPSPLLDTSSRGPSAGLTFDRLHDGGFDVKQRVSVLVIPW